MSKKKQGIILTSIGCLGVIAGLIKMISYELTIFTPWELVACWAKALGLTALIVFIVCCLVVGIITLMENEDSNEK